MAGSNFMLSDLIGTWAALFIFSLFLVFPGYVCGWLIDALGFRRRSVVTRLAISVPLSIGISPILAYLLWHWSLAAVWVVFGAMAIGFLGLLFHERRFWLSPPGGSRRRVAFVAITFGWIVLGTLCLIDLQFKQRLYFSLVAYDYTLRTAITAAITRSGIPPNNPYFFPGHAVLLRYHYFWFILCSLVDQIGKTIVSPRQAMLAGTLWSGIGLIAIIPLYLRFFQPKGPENLQRRMLIAVGLLSVTGLNFLPIAVLDFFGHNLLVTDTAVLPWISDLLWVPHHVAALIACLIGFLVIWYRSGMRDWRADVLTCVGAGTMFADAFGLSVYVTLVFAFFVTVWILITAFRQKFRETALMCAAGFVSLAICLPYSFELLGVHAKQSSGGGSFLQFGIRSFPLTEALISSSDLRGWRVPLANALLLPLNYVLALGFPLLVAFVQWRRMHASKNSFGRPEMCGFTMAATSILVCTFLRSGVITYNDLGTRGVMVAQFVFVIWCADLLQEGLLARRVNTTAARGNLIRLSKGGRNLLVAALVLGVAGTINDLWVSRFLPIIEDATSIQGYSWLPSDHNLGSRTYALRQLYDELKLKLPRTAVMQHNPRTSPGDLFQGLYADRQVAADTLECGTVFGGDPGLCRQIIGPIDDLFEKPGAVDAARVDAACKALSINALVVKDTDAVWADKNSWVWKKEPLIANRYARAFLCSSADSSIK